MFPKISSIRANKGTTGSKNFWEGSEIFGLGFTTILNSLGLDKGQGLSGGRVMPKFQNSILS